MCFEIYLFLSIAEKVTKSIEKHREALENPTTDEKIKTEEIEVSLLLYY